MLHTLMAVTLIGTAMGMGTYATTRSIQMQRRLAGWTNDDAVAKDILKHIRRDASRARDARLIGEESATLEMTGPSGPIRYRLGPDTVERIAEAAKGPADSSTWRFQRSTLRWAVERGQTGGGVVWVVVQIRDPIQRSRPLTHQFATGVRLGGLAAVENSP